MKAMIKNGDQLLQWFLALAVHCSAEERWHEGICVTTTVRREILTSDRQGKIIVKGSVRTIEFETLGGGVYRAYLTAAGAEGGK